MPVTIERQEDHSTIRLEGELTVTSASELKNFLLQGLLSGSDLRLDLEHADAIDITVMQLLCAAGREADRAGVAASIRLSEAAAGAAREAGFQHFKGLAAESVGWQK